MVFENLPEKLVKRLMPFQRDGVKFAIAKNGRCLIADEMGLGKTLQAISVAYYYRNEWPLLIIVPSSLRYSWIEEFEKWLPDINPGDINLVQSGNDVSDIGTAQVTITTFGLLSKGTSRILREALMNQGFNVVIVDESHYIRNAKTISAKTVVPLIKNANRRILLSGTPALSRPVELYPQIDSICPGEFGTWWTYTARFCDARVEWIGKVRRRNVNGASNLEELQQKLSDRLMIRREKSQVLTQLPPKQRQRVLFDLRDSELKKEIRQTFDELRPMLKRSSQDNFEVLTGAGEHDGTDTNVLSLIQRLYRLSGTAKIGPAKEYVEMLSDNPNLKFLVFAYHHDMMNGLSESLHDKKVKFIRIDGETPPSERPHLVHKFQSDPDTRVAILSILAAGVGLTFTAATLVVFAEMYWTPGTMVQCEDRAHRIGQTSCVAVHYLVAKNTMDEWVWSAVCKKTIVTSTTLTGKKRKMEALEGDSYQIDVLSNADVWVPTSNNESTHLTQYFETALDSNQKSILHFFSPNHPNNKKKLMDSHSNNNYTTCNKDMNSFKEGSLIKALEDQDCVTPVRKRMKMDTQSVDNGNDRPSASKGYFEGKENAIVVIDSEEDDFVDNKSTSRKSLCTSKKRKREKPRKSILSPKSSLEAMFEKVKSKELEEESVDLRTDEVTPVKVPESSKASISKKHDHSNERESCSKGTAVGHVIKKWNCSICTYLNHKDLNYCEMCETPKKSGTASKLQSLENNRSGSLKNKDEINSLGTKNNLDEANESVTGTYSEMESETVLTEESEDVEDHGRYVDDALDFDPGNESYLNENFDEVDKTQETVSEIEKTDYDSVDSDGPGSEDIIPESNTVKQADACQSRYFNTSKQTSSPVRSKRKEVRIENKLNWKTPSSDKESKENDGAIVKCNMEAMESQQIGTFTPTSRKKYRFKSVRGTRSLGSSPIVSSPVGYSVNDSVKIEDRLKTRPVNDDNDKVVDETVASVESKTDREHENLERDCKVDDVNCGKINKVKTVNKTNSDSDRTLTPKSRKPCKDYSFSSPEFDEIVATETEKDITKDVKEVEKDEKRVVDLDTVPVYTMFKYLCSKYTDRIYLLTQEEENLNLNFIPSDVQFGNDDGLPDILLHPDNLRLVQRFVREWQSLTETKRRLIIKSGQSFISPLVQYEKLRSCKSVNTQRHKSKVDTSKAAHQKAKDINGSVRLVSKHSGVHDENSGEQGVAQAVSEDGTPLCLQCFQPYTNHLITKASIQDENNAWNTRFCSRKCSQEYWMVSNNDYIRDRVFEAEHGICQMCQFDAHSLFTRVRDTTDQRKKAEIITKTKYNSLTVKVKEQMVRKPAAGQFWHADHIVPVWEGGGQCDIDNLRTLCIICHQKITAKQAAKRATVRKLGTAVNSGDITAFFQRN